MFPQKRSTAVFAATLVIATLLVEHVLLHPLPSARDEYCPPCPERPSENRIINTVVQPVQSNLRCDPSPSASASAAQPQIVQVPVSVPTAPSRAECLHWKHKPTCNAAVTRHYWDFFGVPSGHAFGESGTITTVIALLEKHNVSMNKYAVNWGANDGKSQDPIYALYEAGWSGFAVELRDELFEKLKINVPWDRVVKQAVAITPMNTVSLLEGAGAPTDMDVWKVDIDGYDLSILQALLGSGKFRPKLIVMEANEKIPPPIRFAMNYHATYAYMGDHFYGTSAAAVDDMLTRFNYRIVVMDWNNLLYVDGAYCAHFAGLISDITGAYDAGYRSRPMRAETFPWNSNVDQWLTMDTLDAIRAIQDFMVATPTYKNGKQSFTLQLDHGTMPVADSC